MCILFQYINLCLIIIIKKSYNVFIYKNAVCTCSYMNPTCINTSADLKNENYVHVYLYCIKKLLSKAPILSGFFQY